MFPFIEYFGGQANFRRDYKCFSAGMLLTSNRDAVDSGGKIVMPPSALDALSRMNVQFPILFKITNNVKKRTSHCGVLEFVAEEGRVYIPSWMMRNMQLNEGDLISVANVSIPVATFSKFQPVSSDFLDITDPRAVLERGLRGFACLTVGDVVAFEYNNKVQELVVLETKPADAVSIIECDMQVDFAPPIDYKEPEYKKKHGIHEEQPIMIDADTIPGAPSFTAFRGTGARLGGSKRKSTSVSPADQSAESNVRLVDVSTLNVRGIPNYNWRPGKLTFRRKRREEATKENLEQMESGAFSAFKGIGFALTDMKGAEEKKP